MLRDCEPLLKERAAVLLPLTLVACSPAAPPLVRAKLAPPGRLLTPANERVLLHRGRSRLRQALEDTVGANS